MIVITIYTYPVSSVYPFLGMSCAATEAFSKKISVHHRVLSAQ